ncbi:MAG: hypothetical protein WA971_11015 [Microbacterium sp.]
MTPRLLDCSASDFIAMDKPALLHAIRSAEGRTLLCETASLMEPLIPGITNAEVAASLGADLLLLNFFDVERPAVRGIPDGTAPDEVIARLKQLTGRPIGINLEPVDEKYAPAEGDPYHVPSGRVATPANARRAAELGVDIIVLTGNPGAGVSNETIADALRTISDEVGDRVILAAGRMHAAGVFGAPEAGLLDEGDVDAFVEAGADIVLLPVPGTVPGVTPELVRRLIARAHAGRVLAMTTIGTSQEGADEATIRQFALAAKIAGADLHHIGDACYSGIASPENVQAYSIAIRGRRHTLARMARSIQR